MRPGLRLLLVAAVAALLVVPPVLAAGLGLTSKKLTVFTKPVTTCTLAAAPNPSTVETDAYVREDTPTTNYGTATAISVRSNPGARRFGLIRFDVTQCSIPAGASLLSAMLKVVLTTAPATSRTYQVYRLGSSWIETGGSGVTWVTRPSIVSSSTKQTTLGAALTSLATSMTVADASAFPAAPFTVTVDSEAIRVGAKSGNTFSSLTRGYYGTTAAAHLLGAPVQLLAPGASLTTGTTSGATLSANVRSDVQALLGGTANYGWQINDGDETTNATGGLGARESTTATDRPQLVIAYAT